MFKDRLVPGGGGGRLPSRSELTGAPPLIMLKMRRCERSSMACPLSDTTALPEEHPQRSRNWLFDGERFRFCARRIGEGLGDASRSKVSGHSVEKRARRVSTSVNHCTSTRKLEVQTEEDEGEKVVQTQLSCNTTRRFILKGCFKITLIKM